MDDYTEGEASSVMRMLFGDKSYARDHRLFGKEAMVYLGGGWVAYSGLSFGEAIARACASEPGALLKAAS